MCKCVEFLDEILLRRGECKTRENSNFLKKGKMVISVKIRNFYRFWMTKWTSPLESSREIYVEFRNSRNLHIFRGNESSAGHVAHFEWLTMCHVSGA